MQNFYWLKRAIKYFPCELRRTQFATPSLFNNFIKVIKKFFWNFRKISDFSVGDREKLQNKFELILKKICNPYKKTVEKLCRNLMKFGKFWSSFSKTLKTCSEIRTINKFLKNFEKCSITFPKNWRIIFQKSWENYLDILR